MAWCAQLTMDYQLAVRASLAQTVLAFEHQGPLRILKSLYPEGPQVCHNVLVHPPSGLAGGDDLRIDLNLAPQTHALITTPGATRFYKTLGETTYQHVTAILGEQARLEWLPLENIAFNGCVAENCLQLRLAPGAELIGWDVTVLGLPAANEQFLSGSFTQNIELKQNGSEFAAWLERGRIAATDHRLRQSVLGLTGKGCLATMFFVAGSALETTRKTELLLQTQNLLRDSELRAASGVTSPHAQVVVLRCLASSVEPVFSLLKQTRRIWRQVAWQLPDTLPRIWSM